MRNFKKIRNILFGAIIALALVFVACYIVNNLNSTNMDVYRLNLSSIKLANEATGDSSIFGKAVGAGIVVGLAALGGTIAMGMSVAKSAESISRQPEAESKIRTTLMLGLVFIETLVIYALIVAILVIFVL